METEILQKLNEYANRRIALHLLEEWLVSRLQRILDSRDEKSISIANEIDGLLVQLSEGVIGEAGVMEVVDLILRAESTVYVPADADEKSEIDDSSSETIPTTHTVTTAGETVRLELVA